MHKSAGAILAIWHDIAEDAWDKAIDWYDREHHIERVRVPGFLSARRFVAVEGAPKLFIRYEVENIDVLTSAPYLERVNNPTPWTLQSQPNFRNNSRTVCAIAGRAGTGEGGFAATIRLAPRKEKDAAAALDWDRLSARLTALPGLLSAEVWIGDSGRSAVRSREKELRGADDHMASLVVVLHGTGEAALRAAVAREFGGSERGEDWRELDIGVYRLAFSLGADDVVAIR